MSDLTIPHESGLAPAVAPKKRGSLLVVFDGTCGFCQRSVRIIRRLDWLRMLPAEAFTSASARDAALATSGLDEGIRTVDTRGRIRIGITAVRAMTLRMPLFFWVGLLLYIPPVTWVGARAYKWVAARRHRFGGSESCALPDPPRG